ncbi:hypothetical protein RFI_04995 [Reticulomyxa filosa]|uniref:Uncharacterized protein n=1 Tax=Reticulomyxa filosa TaxID=46433 RepID=X6P1J6_RETFI|nr:hypothetical protein RFI_04995 [Reticulomyxa filosa]|eukprot:ETO32126.1 hypothetical protein RFI_04995 [Reticulomyxa filosa]
MYTNSFYYICNEHVKVVGGMQSEPESGKYETEMKALVKLYGDVMKEEELKKYIYQNNGNVSMVIEQITTILLNQKVISLSHKNTIHLDIIFCTAKINRLLSKIQPKRKKLNKLRLS